MKTIRVAFAITLFLAFGWQGAASAQQERFVSFQEFLSDVSMTPDAPGVASVEELSVLRQHILSMYEGVEVSHSFLLDSQYFDCVPVHQQPSVRRLGLTSIAAEPAAASGSPLPEGARRLESPLTLGLEDAFGHAVECDEGTIPMRRITLEELSRFGNLRAFFRKTPWGEPGPFHGEMAASAAHKYAHAYQFVKNYGGNSWLNLWSPTINESLGQIFSLSQHWYVGGTGKRLQTVEGGWQVYPYKYNTSKAALFIFWTADNYAKTGCYNLDCPGFVQTNRKWALGGTWSNYSTKGGTQWMFQMQWKFTGGNWWLFLQGSGAYEAIGYYPGSLYKGGQLTKYATRIDYGGETVGTSSFPPMGSGSFASQGAGQAAFQSLIFYLPTPGTSKWASLKATQPSSKCYTIRLTPASSGGSSGTFFYFGGPGGGSC